GAGVQIGVGTSAPPTTATAPQPQPLPTPVAVATDESNKDVYVYRKGPKKAKTVALNRFVDFVSGLSFFLTPQVDGKVKKNLRYKVKDLIGAGYAVRLDPGGSPITDIRTGKYPPDANDYPSTSYPEAKDNSRIFQPDTFQNNGHVTVWVPFIPVWDVWYYDERSHKGEEYASPWTLALLFGVPNEEVPVP
ncbi:MAG TPA: hypothetical protein VH593_15415, partial [Ktedonobacteraceae bacterium]